jgi:hypothetical protein
MAERGLSEMGLTKRGDTEVHNEMGVMEKGVMM